VRLLSIPNTKPPTKFEVSSSNSSGDMFDRIPKIVGSRDLGHAHFQCNLFVRPLIPDTKLNTKFEVSSSSSFRDIALLAYWGHEFNLSKSRDVIGHVTIR